MHRLVDAIQNLDRIAKEHGVSNIFQPGLAKELIIAKHLGHTVHLEKHGPDAYCELGLPCEYLTANSGCQVQIDRMFAQPEEKRKISLQRIEKYGKIYAVYFLKQTLTVESIYELDRSELLKEANRMLDISCNDIAHLSFGRRFILSIGSSVKFGETL